MDTRIQRSLINFAVLVIVAGSISLFTLRQAQKALAEITKLNESYPVIRSLSQPIILVDSLKPGDFISSPLIVEGKARRAYFEASFPVTLKDGQGNVLAKFFAQAQSDWMTDKFVSYKAILEFKKPETAEGILELEGDDPAGFGNRPGLIIIPVRFR